jgi:hypothetical protein
MSTTDTQGNEWQDPLDFGAMERGSSRTLQSIIKNVGKKPQLWALSVGGASWLTLDIGVGVLQIDGEQTINVTADTTSLGEGDYSAILTVIAEADDVAVTTRVNVTLVVATDVLPRTFLLAPHGIIIPNHQKST